MKNIVIIVLGALAGILFLAAVILGVSNVRKSHRIVDLEGKLSTLRAGSAGGGEGVQIKKAEFSRVAKSVTKKIPCPACKGTGKHTILLDHKNDIVYGCPVCRTTGHNIVKLEYPNKLCPTCQGMGVRGIQQKGSDGHIRWGARVCTKCNALGYVKAGRD